ncbi:MAG: RNA polymerase sigma factor [Pseudomonadales bacterium]
MRFHASEEDAEDLLQATFEKIIALRRLPPDLEAPGAYLWRIAVNCAQDWLRRQRPEISVGGTMELEPLHTGLQPDHAQSFIASESLRRAFTRFARDHPERAAALTLLVVEQWNGTELAAYLQRSPGASREYLHNAGKSCRVMSMRKTRILPSEQPDNLSRQTSICSRRTQDQDST